MNCKYLDIQQYVKTQKHWIGVAILSVGAMLGSDTAVQIRPDLAVAWPLGIWGIPVYVNKYVTEGSNSPKKTIRIRQTNPTGAGRKSKVLINQKGSPESRGGLLD